MKNTKTSFSMKNKLTNLSVRFSQHRIVLAICERLQMTFGIKNYKRELIDLNSFSSRLLQRLSSTYQKRTAHPQTTWTITPSIQSTADECTALTFHEFSSNIEHYQKVNNARWNDNLVEEILSIKN